MPLEQPPRQGGRWRLAEAWALRVAGGCSPLVSRAENVCPFAAHSLLRRHGGMEVVGPFSPLRGSWLPLGVLLPGDWWEARTLVLRSSFAAGRLCLSRVRWWVWLSAPHVPHSLGDFAGLINTGAGTFGKKYVPFSKPLELS